MSAWGMGRPRSSWTSLRILRTGRKLRVAVAAARTAPALIFLPRWKYKKKELCCIAATWRGRATRECASRVVTVFAPLHSCDHFLYPPTQPIATVVMSFQDIESGSSKPSYSSSRDPPQSREEAAFLNL